MDSRALRLLLAHFLREELAITTLGRILFATPTPGLVRPTTISPDGGVGTGKLVTNDAGRRVRACRRFGCAFAQPTPFS